MALANIAWLLGEELNRKVLVVDWDLEAPGLHRFFGIKDEEISGGLIEILEDYKDLLRKESGRLPEDLVDLGKYVRVVEVFSGGGSISILAAGRQNVASEYAAKINAFSWEEFYAKWHGFGFIEHLKQRLRSFGETDIILVDSRTGVTDIGGICTLQLPDIVVILFAMNDQNIVGAKSVAERILKKAAELEGRNRPPILILRPARVERSSGNQDKKLEWQAKAARQLGEYFADRDPETVIAKRNIPYVSDFSYGETPLAVVKDPLGDMTDAFKDLAETIMQASEGGPVDANSGQSFFHNLIPFALFKFATVFSQKRNVYLLTCGFILLLIANFTRIAFRDLRSKNQTVQETIVAREREIADLKMQLYGVQPTPSPSPSPIAAANVPQFSINIADGTQEEMANLLSDALVSQGYSMLYRTDVIRPGELTPQTYVKYFFTEDKDEANRILGILQKQTCIDATVDPNVPNDNETPRTFEIWFKKGDVPGCQNSP